MRLLDLSPILRREMVASALPQVLAGLDGPAGTWDVCHGICAALSSDEMQPVGRILTELAAAGHPNAVRGESFLRFGRTMKRWNWVPAAKPASPLVSCPHCAARDFPHNMRGERCVTCEWTV